MPDIKAKKVVTKKGAVATVKPSGKQAVILLGGKQYIVSENDELKVEKIDKKENSKFDVKDVLAIMDGDKEIDLGTPRSKAKVTAVIIEHGKDDKIYVIKYKPKVRYRRKIGHRQRYTKIKITSIS